MIVFVAITLYLQFMLKDASNAALRASCQNNMKQLGLMLQIFGRDNRSHAFPQLSAKPGRLAVLNQSPEYGPSYTFLGNLESRNIVYCDALPRNEQPVRPEKSADAQALLDNSSYFYLGYAVSNDDEVQAFADAYKNRVKKGLPFSEDLEISPGTDTGGENLIYRLKEGVERFYITDINNPQADAIAQSKIPTLIERLGHHHNPEGGNVLFMDGHVEFIQYPGPWPMTEKTMRILQSLEAMREK
jgi:prepilin-type processing-associated H-X9-DG protein